MENSHNNNKSLSIRISTDGLSFCVFAPNEAQPYTYKEYDVKPVMSMAANLKEALTNDPIFRDNYQRVNVLISTPQFTTLPAEGFNKDKAEAVFRFVQPNVGHCHVSYNILRHAQAVVLFGIDKDIRQLILDDFPRARFYASPATLIEFFAEKSLGGQGKHIFVYLHEGKLMQQLGQQRQEMVVYAFDQGQFLFVNSYDVRSTNDCAFYLLNVWKTLHFDQLDDALSIVDDAQASIPLANQLQDYIKDIRLIDRENDFQQKLSSTQLLLPYDLQTLLVCGI